MFREESTTVTTRLEPTKILFDNVDMNEYVIENEIGKGAYATVRLGYKKG